MEALLYRIYHLMAIGCYALSWGIFVLLCWALTSGGFTYMYTGEGDLAVLILAFAVVILQSTLLMAYVKHKLRRMAIPMAVVCMVACGVAAAKLRSMPPGPDDRWDRMGLKLFPPPKR